MSQYKIWNGVFPTHAALQLAVATGTAVKTMLQMKTLAGIQARVKAWGVSMNGSAAAPGVQWELIETGTVAATVTAHADVNIAGWDSGGIAAVASTYLAPYATNTNGYTASAEGTITASRVLDSQLVQPTGQYAWEFSLGNEPLITAANILRIRCKAATTVDAICWMLVEV